MIIDHCSLICRISRHGIGLLDPGARRVGDSHRLTDAAGSRDPRTGEDTVALSFGEGVAVDPLDRLGTRFVRVLAAATCGYDRNQHGHEPLHILAPYLCALTTLRPPPTLSTSQPKHSRLAITF